MVTSFTIPLTELTQDSFRRFGEVLGPAGNGSTVKTNATFAQNGEVRMDLPVPAERFADFDVFEYWPGVARLSSDPMKLGLLRPRSRPLSFSWMERHVRGSQAFIPLGGRRSVIAVAPDTGIDDPHAVPLLGDMRAFVIDGTVGLNIRPGTWHWTPFPLDEGAELLILVRADANKDDLNFIDLEVALGTRIHINADIGGG